LEWFETCSCKPIPMELPSSFTQLYAAWPGAKAVMLIDVIAATIHRTPVLGFCIGAPRKRRPSQPRLLLKTYVYQGARPRTMGHHRSANNESRLPIWRPGRDALSC